MLGPCLRLLLVASTVVALAACSPSAAPPARTPAPGPSSRAVAAERVPDRLLDASVAQFRNAEGTRDLLAGVTNNSERTIRVTTGTIDWSGFRFPTVEITDPTIPSGETAAFTIRYGRPVCGTRPGRSATMVTTVDGRTRRLPLRVQDPWLLVRLHRDACLAQSLDAVADVRLRLADRPREVRGQPVLPGDVVLQRRPRARAAVQVVELSGSVLLDLAPRQGAGALPARLGPSQASLSLPVYLASTGRCDAHALGQSQQTFLLGVYVRRGRGPVQRVLTVPGPAQQRTVMRMLSRACRLR